jgi:hypothetical protein
MPPAMLSRRLARRAGPREERDTADARYEMAKLSRIGKRECSLAGRSFYIWSTSAPETETVSQSDPTDDALAAIASILDHPTSPREPEKTSPEREPQGSGSVEAEGYSKVGPGPMESVRFKWTVRRESDGQYFVDETIGENSRPVSNGPMSADAAIRFVDDQASEARQRFEALRSEMAGRAAATAILQDEGTENPSD